jgi:hypothetical protein
MIAEKFKRKLIATLRGYKLKRLNTGKIMNTINLNE